MTVDVAPVADLYDNDQDFEVSDLIDDPVLTLSNTETVVA